MMASGGNAVPAGLRPYLPAGLALATAGVIAVAPPVASPLTEPSAAGAAIALMAGESLFNVPLNLFQDIVNIPYYETQALNVAAQSLLFTGPWFAASPTNIWGEDPGDPGHFESLINMAIPFPELSGLGHDGDYTYPGLGQQLAMLAAVEIPANPSCAALDCLPMIPTSPIIGLTLPDSLFWLILLVTGLQKFPLMDGWFQVPLSEITQGDGYYFSSGSPASIASGPVHAYPGFPWPGTHNPSPEELAQYPNLAPNTNLMPWAGTYFKLDLAAPFHNFFTSLQQPFDPGDFHLVNSVDFARAVQASLAGAFLDFNPFTRGSPYCPGSCQLPDGSPTYYGFIKVIDALWPNNPLLDEWLKLFAAGQVNVSTPEILDYLTWMWRNDSVVTDFYNGLATPYGNPPPPDPVISTGLPTLLEVNDWIETHFGHGPRVFLDNVGILGPFDFDNLWNLFFPLDAL